MMYNILLSLKAQPFSKLNKSLPCKSTFSMMRTFVKAYAVTSGICD